MKNSFGEQFLGVALQTITNHFGEQFSAITLGSNFRELFWGIDLKNHSFGAVALDSSFADNFGEQFLALKHSSFRLDLEGISGSNFK